MAPAPDASQSPQPAAGAAGPQPQLHRAPWVVIVSAIVVLILLGTLIAVLVNRATTSGSSSGILPSPGSVGTPSPKVSPSPVGPGGATASNDVVTFAVPAGWTISSPNGETITITNPNGDGSVTVGSGRMNPAQTAQQDKDRIDRFYDGRYPDTRSCSGSKTTTGALNGQAGIFWEECFTLTAAGQSVPAEAAVFAGANSDGSVYYLVVLLTNQSNVKTFVNQTASILESIHWKLT